MRTWIIHNSRSWHKSRVDGDTVSMENLLIKQNTTAAAAAAVTESHIFNKTLQNNTICCKMPKIKNNRVNITNRQFAAYSP